MLVQAFKSQCRKCSRMLLMLVESHHSTRITSDGCAV